MISNKGQMDISATKTSATHVAPDLKAFETLLRKDGDSLLSGLNPGKGSKNVRLMVLKAD